MGERTEIGRIVRLQIQLSSLKAGPPKGRYYDPSPIRVAPHLDVNCNGAVASVNGEDTIDVHNSTHPATKNRSGINSLSIGFTSHYARMRERLGSHLIEGIAGENILVETDRLIDFEMVGHGFVIEGEDGQAIHLTNTSVAHPCAEFSRFALDDLAATPHEVSEALRFLDNGCRGFYAAVESLQLLRIEEGDRVFLRRER